MNIEAYKKIYSLVSMIPRGRVATYGQLAGLVGRCTARMAGYALSATPEDVRIPWQRVVNSRGSVSRRGGGGNAEDQRRLLEREGVRFDSRDKIDLNRFLWKGPPSAWLAENGIGPFRSAPAGRGRSFPGLP